jgi:predicted nucleic acid-binding protein
VGTLKIVDNNVLIYHADGKLQHPLDSDCAISILTEIEALAHPQITAAMDRKLRALVAAVTVIPLDEAIKEEAIKLLCVTKLRVPDAIIAATALVCGAELLTHDSSLLRLQGLAVSAPTLKP